MKLSWRARRRWALVLLLVGLPVYIVVAAGILGRLDRAGVLMEVLVYGGLGVIWALPFRFLFSGIGRPDPDAPDSAPREPTRK